jgi:hypothetical protein
LVLLVKNLASLSGSDPEPVKCPISIVKEPHVNAAVSGGTLEKLAQFVRFIVVKINGEPQVLPYARGLHARLKSGDRVHPSLRCRTFGQNAAAVVFLADLRQKIPEIIRSFRSYLETLAVPDVDVATLKLNFGFTVHKPETVNSTFNGQFIFQTISICNVQFFTKLLRNVRYSATI